MVKQELHLPGSLALHVQGAGDPDANVTGLQCVGLWAFGSIALWHLPLATISLLHAHGESASVRGRPCRVAGAAHFLLLQRPSISVIWSLAFARVCHCEGSGGAGMICIREDVAMDGVWVRGCMGAPSTLRSKYLTVDPCRHESKIQDHVEPL